MECSWDEALLQAVPQLPAEVLQLIQSGDNVDYLSGLAQVATHPKHCHTLLALCGDLFVALLIRIHHYGSPDRLVSTLGRVVSLAPHTVDCAIALLSKQIFDFTQPASADELTQYLLGVFRLLRHNHRSFQHNLNTNSILSLLDSPITAHRYLAIRILQLCLDGADDWFEDMLRKYIGKDDPKHGIDGVWDDTIIDYRFLSLWEDWRIQQLAKALEARHTVKLSTPRRVLLDLELGPGCVRIGQTVVYSKSGHFRDETNAFVLTSSVSRNLDAMGRALKNKRPILLTGAAGSGKTSLIRHVATKVGKEEKLITLHLNEQSDAKLLLGVYMSGSTPGSISWAPGVLTTAVQEGRWVLIEDIDRAPTHVLGALLPLIEHRTLSISSRKHTIHAHHDFRLFATHSTSGVRKSSLPLSTMLGRRHWVDVAVQPLATTEMLNIVEMQQPAIHALLPQMIAVFEGVQQVYSSSGFSARTKSGIIRAVGVTDFIKWCGRAARYLKSGTDFNAEAVDNIFLEALDCFTAALAQDQAREEVYSIIAQYLNIDPQRRDFLVEHRAISYEESVNSVTIGRYRIPRSGVVKVPSHGSFSANDHVLRNMERIAASLEGREPVLLVGETGVGKTTAVQHLAKQLGKKLVPFNLSQQSESGDLLGSLKPANIRTSIVALKEEFDTLFEASFSHTKNQQFTEQVNKYFARSHFKAVCKLWRTALKMVEEQISASSQATGKPSKRRKPNSLDPARQAAWADFASSLTGIERQISGGKDGLTFRFVEGNIVKALRAGNWILLDEINLASSDTLEAIADILDPLQPSILLTEAGSTERIIAHHDFRVFAAMNPATDVGKKDLPPSIRSRFTEIYVSSPDKDLKSLQSIVHAYLRKGASLDPKVATDVSLTYQQIISLSAQNKLVDGAGQRPHFSLRTLTRVLSYAQFIAPQCSLRRALYEGFQMSFMTFLDAESAQLVLPIIRQHLLRKPTNWSAELKKVLNQPDDNAAYVLAYPSSKHWIKQGREQLQDESHYIITPFIQSNMENLVRAASTRQFPVLIQGPTSSGKTSMIEYLAKRTGNVFVRINNHEHTDLQEYLGTYVSAPDGTIRFQEGLLVQALREGHWIVLDELNLAPTDVLEALNRLLDDNRELLVPETQETIRPHPNFMLFATQNPAGLYGGRKTLSRAFRNRFLELHFDDIPVDELQEILHKRTQLPESRCKKIVTVYKELSILRQENRLFEQKSFATLRDLFRWAFRTNDTIQQLADNGFMLLADRVRKPQERLAIKEVLEKVMSLKGPKVRIDEDTLYSLSSPDLRHLKQNAGNENVVWTNAMRRLFTLVAVALGHNEPVLLVGDTGCGKTTVCQMVAEAKSTALHVVNAHQNTETSDLIGSQRPVRNRSTVEQELRQALLASDGIDLSLDLTTLSTADLLEMYEQSVSALNNERRQAMLQTSKHRALSALVARSKALFEWVDGSLVQAMKAGHMFLLDEISLADDSVLERMNSVLEPARTVLLAEKGSIDALVTAQEGFQFLATMNPGGDYGKKELSPALRNRFTEIWVPTMTDMGDVLQIIQHGLVSVARPASSGMQEFAQWFTNTFKSSEERGLSIREMLSWVAFINLFAEHDLASAVVHGAALVYIDTLGANPAGLTSMTSQDVRSDRAKCLARLSMQFDVAAETICANDYLITKTREQLVVGPFHLMRRGVGSNSAEQFNFAARATRLNALRVIRAMQLPKPIMLEGNPGVGKTALVTAIAANAGISLTRINLSDQTDLIDLFGSDAPVEGSAAGTFEWREAPFLRAMRTGQWVLLDEMNLASQSVLEGLNAVLDHRGEAYIPELGQSFKKHEDFRLFAAQNPHHQGGGRKGLPASFVNRFTVVYADPFDANDLQLLGSVAYPAVSADMLQKTVQFITTVESDVSQHRVHGQLGAPLEFNFRDISRWLQLACSTTAFSNGANAYDLASFLIKQRFRSSKDRSYIDDAFATAFGSDSITSDTQLIVSRKEFQVGISVLPRNLLYAANPDVSHNSTAFDLQLVQHLMLSIQFSWPVLLVGPSGCGKTGMIERLASMTGSQVMTISLSADTDTMDLIGGYEQADIFRETCSAIQFFDEECKGHAKLEALTASTNHAQLMQEWRVLCDLYLKEQLSFREFREKLDKVPLAGIGSLLAMLDKLRPSNSTAHFVWVDGVLVDALRSVLDRLNSLLESNGSLIINEHVEEDGSPRVIRPHPTTRIFLTADPQYGELSRAMRNRAVELFAGPLGHAIKHTEQLTAESSLQRFRRAACLKQITPPLDLGRALSLMPQILGLDDHTILHRYVLQLSRGLYDLDAIGLDALESMLWTPPAYYREQLAGLYRKAAEMRRLSADFAHVQTVHPLNHQLLLSYTESLSTSAIRAGLCYDLLNAVKPIFETMESVRSNKALMARLGRLENQFIIKAEPSSTKRIPYMLFTAETLSRSVVESYSSRPTTRDDEVSVLQLFSGHRLMVTVLQRLINAAIAQQPEPALLSSYLTLIHDQSRGTDFESANDATHTSLSARSCTTMWQSLKPSVLLSANAFHGLETLEDLCHQFDALSHHDNHSLNDIVRLRLALRQAYHKAISSQGADLEPLTKQLADALAQFDNNTSKRREYTPHFQSSFRSLWHRFSELERLGNSFDALILQQISFLSNSITLEGLHSHIKLSGIDTAILADSRIMDNETSGMTGSQLSLVKLLRSLATTKEVSIRHLSTLRIELGVLSSSILGQSQHLQRAEMPMLDKVLQTIFIGTTRALGLLPTSGVDESDTKHISHALPMDSTSESAFQQVDRYLRNLQDTQTEQSRQASQAWVAMGLLGLRTYLPDGIHDPGLNAILARETFERCVADQTQDLRDVEAFNVLLSGQHTSWRSRTIIDTIRALGDGPPAPDIFRPAIAKNSALQKDIEALKQLLSKIVEFFRSPDAQDMPTTLVNNLAGIRSRLRDDYREYMDFVGPIIAFSDCILVGQSLAQRANNEASGPRKSTKVLDLVPFLSRQSSLISTPEQLLESLPSNASIPERLTWLEAVTARIPNWHNEAEWAEVASIVFDQFAAFYNLWRNELSLDQKRHAAKSSLFKYEAADEEDDEALLAAEVAQLFSLPEAENTSSTLSTQLRIHQLAPEIASIHLKLLTQRKVDGTELVALLQYVASHLLDLIPEEGLRALPVALSPLRSVSNDILNASTVPTTYNFYKHGCPAKVDSLQALLRRIMLRFDTIHEDWPEHALPIEILRGCNTILDLPYTTTLPRILQPLEQLHSILNEWQKIAHSGISANDLYNAVTDMIIDWRRLELSTWAALFRDQDEQCRIDTLSWWFTAYETIIETLPQDPKQLDSHVETLMGTLQAFMEGCGIGEYVSRLQLLSQFAAQLEVTSTMQPTSVPIAAALRNFVSYYERYKGIVMEHFTLARSKLETAVKEIVQLASWKDRNIDSLRQSAQSSHRKLARILRKYRNLLAEPVQPIITSCNNKKHDRVALSFRQDKHAQVSPSIAIETSIDDISWSTRPARYRNIGITSSLIYQKADMLQNSLSACQRVGLFLAEITGSVKELRAATPTTKTQQNTKTLGQLKARKRRLLADVLKALRLMGLQQNISDDMLAKQSSFAIVLTKLQYLASRSSTTPEHDLLFALLSKMQVVRDGARKHSDDITSREAARCVMLMESLLSLLLAQHNSLCSMQRTKSRFNQVYAKLVATTNAGTLTTYNFEQLASRLTEQKSFVNLSSAALSLISKHLALAQTKSSDGINILQSAIEQSVQCVNHVDVQQMPRGIQGDSSLEAITKSTKAIQEIARYTSQVLHEQPEYAYILSYVQQHIPTASFDRGQPGTLGVSSWIQTLFACLDSLLIRVDSLDQHTSKPSNQEDWLKMEQHHIVEKWKSLKLEGTTDQLEGILQALSSLEQEAIRDASNILRIVLPILEANMIVADQLSAYFANLYESTSTLALNLADMWIDLVDKGFCTPAEKSDGEDSTSGAVESGTGLGDGDGADDISKDVKQDEDLSELAQQQGQQEREDGLEDEKDAVDMADEELEGELGDAENGSQADDGDDQDDNQPDMDEEVGSVNSDDAEALDEKKWDDGKLDDGQSKEDKKGSGAKEDEVAAGQDELANENQQGDEADEGESSEAGADDEGMPQQESGQLDPHVQEQDVLDLADDMNMDNEVSDDDLAGSDLDMDDESETSMLDKQDDHRPQEEDQGMDDPTDDVQPEADKTQDQADTNNEVQDDDEINAEDLLQADAEPEAINEEEEKGMVAGQPGDGLDNDTTENVDAPNQSEALNESEVQGSGTQQDTSGTQGQSMNSAEELNDAQPPEEQISEAVSHFRKLGDVLEKWNNQRQPIQSAENADDRAVPEEEDDDSANQFEHLKDENDEADTQALGLGGVDQGTTHLDDMSVDDNDENEDQPIPPRESPEEGATHAEPQDAETDQDPTLLEHHKDRAMVGKQAQNQEDNIPDVGDDRESVLDDMDVQLVNTHISEEQPSQSMDVSQARQLWSDHENSTRQLSLMLAEHLRLILQPTQATKMRGDFRTGKRLNIKKIIPYIASSYRRDKIWMRRSVPSKRNYQIMLAIDDSKSMAEGDNKALAYETLAMVSRALTILEVGELCVVSFGSDVTVAHDFAMPFTADAGPELFRHFTFDQSHTDIRRLLARSIDLFRAARLRATGSASDLWQLQIIVSDGVCEDHPSIRQLVREAQEERIMVVFIVVDTVIGNEAAAADKKQSILELQKAEFTKDAAGEMQLQMVKYLDTFPFKYYLLVSDVKELPGVLAGALRQWFSEVAETGSG